MAATPPRSPSTQRQSVLLSEVGDHLFRNYGTLAALLAANDISKSYLHEFTLTHTPLMYRAYLMIDISCLCLLVVILAYQPVVVDPI